VEALIATPRGGGTRAALAKCRGDLAGKQSGRRQKLAVDADDAIVGLCEVVEPTDVDGELCRILGVLPSFVLQHNAVFRPHEVAVSDYGSSAITQRGIHLGFRKSGSDDGQTQIRLTGRIGPGANQGECRSKPGGTALAHPRLDGPR
jgi:hypothetical protein